MATVTSLLELLNGLPTNLDLTSSDLVTNSVWVGGTSSAPSVQVTTTLLNSFLTAVVAGDGISVTGGDTVAVDSSVIRTTGANAFAADQAMGGNKLTGLAAATANGDAVRYEQAILADGTNAFSADQSMGTHALTNLADPTNAQDAATKAYVDAHISTEAQGVQTSQTAGEALSADTSYVVRWALTGETAGRAYIADAASAASAGKYLGFGITSKASAVSAGDAITVTSTGIYTLGASDTPFSSSDVGKAVYLADDGSGAVTLTPPTTAGSAVYRIGVVATTSTIWVGTYQLNGVA